MDLPEDVRAALLASAGYFIEASAIAGCMNGWQDMFRADVLEHAPWIELSDADVLEIGGHAMTILLNCYAANTLDILGSSQPGSDEESISDTDFDEIEKISSVLSSVLKVVTDDRIPLFGVDMDQVCRALSRTCAVYRAHIAQMKAENP